MHALSCTCPRHSQHGYEPCLEPPGLTDLRRNGHPERLIVSWLSRPHGEPWLPPQVQPSFLGRNSSQTEDASAWLNGHLAMISGESHRSSSPRHSARASFSRTQLYSQSESASSWLRGHPCEHMRSITGHRGYAVSDCAAAFSRLPTRNASQMLIS
jgi:hypothetical protein